MKKFNVQMAEFAAFVIFRTRGHVWAKDEVSAIYKACAKFPVHIEEHGHYWRVVETDPITAVEVTE